MNKKMLLAAGCTLAVMAAGPVLAAEKDGPYVSGHVGMAMPSDATLTAPGVSLDVDYDSGLAINLALGYRTGPMRLEGEIGYQKSDVDDLTVSVAGLGSVNFKSAGIPFSADVKTTSLLLHAYYDFQNASAFTPYITAGLGMAKVKASFDSPGFGISWSDSDTVFAYQIGVGFEYAINQTVSLDARYRYFATSDPSFDTTDAEFSSHNLMLGARIKF